MLLACTLLMGASNVMDRPARMTTAFELVPREAAMRAVALNAIGFSVMRIFGPALARMSFGTARWLPPEIFRAPGLKLLTAR
jgi:predicted MFS family arabinose efflux permease